MSCYKEITEIFEKWGKREADGFAKPSREKIKTKKFKKLPSWR